LTLTLTVDSVFDFDSSNADDIDFRAYDGLDHGTIQSKKIWECLDRMLK
jgi:hypothetical protein